MPRKKATTTSETSSSSQQTLKRKGNVEVKEAEPTKKRAAASRGSTKVSPKEQLAALFSQYQDPGEEKIGPTGLERFFNDLAVAPDSIYALLLAWQMGAQEMGYFSKEEFIGGLEKLKAYTVEQILPSLQALERAVESDSTRFVDLYKFAFSFSSTASNTKSVDVETAAAMLEVVLPKGPHTSRFAVFLRSRATSYKVINKDQWMCFLEFSKAVQPDLQNYDESEAWPIMFDEFALYVKNGSV
eukprot:TRINITY_DN792_c0_g4_i1.p1 TRINITY_DN792_c0_g4~~TRINITY_DN792_c0_g4_i1.p1  ORF type:complete len:243 (-),score=59.60 TRINITY_DN792_c0_g4_i1:159-887(-)